MSCALAAYETSNSNDGPFVLRARDHFNLCNGKLVDLIRMHATAELPVLIHKTFTSTSQHGWLRYLLIVLTHYMWHCNPIYSVISLSRNLFNIICLLVIRFAYFFFTCCNFLWIILLTFCRCLCHSPINTGIAFLQIILNSTTLFVLNIQKLHLLSG